MYDFLKLGVLVPNSITKAWFPTPIIDDQVIIHNTDWSLPGPHHVVLSSEKIKFSLDLIKIYFYFFPWNNIDCLESTDLRPTKYPWLLFYFFFVK